MHQLGAVLVLSLLLQCFSVKSNVVWPAVLLRLYDPLVLPACACPLTGFLLVSIVLLESYSPLVVPACTIMPTPWLPARLGSLHVPVHVINQ